MDLTKWYNYVFVGAENNILLSKSCPLWIHWGVTVLHLKMRLQWMNEKRNRLHVITSNWLSVLPQMRPVTHKLTCENGFDPHAQTVKRVSDSVCVCAPPTEAASRAIVQFLEVNQSEEASRGWMLLNTINLLASSGQVCVFNVHQMKRSQDAWNMKTYLSSTKKIYTDTVFLRSLSYSPWLLDQNTVKL